MRIQSSNHQAATSFLVCADAPVHGTTTPWPGSLLHEVTLAPAQSLQHSTSVLGIPHVRHVACHIHRYQTPIHCSLPSPFLSVPGIPFDGAIVSWSESAPPTAGGRSTGVGSAEGSIPVTGGTAPPPSLAWIGRESSKPGRAAPCGGEGECWVLHVSHGTHACGVPL